MPWDLRAVSPDFFDTAPQRFVCTEVVRRGPEEIFEAVAADPAGWGDWYPGFDHSGRWTTPEPHGPDSHRTVRMARVTYEETILEWEPPRLFGFRVDRATVPMARAFAESYRIAPHDAGSVVQWVVAFDAGAVLRPMLRFGQGVLSTLFARAMANLERTGPGQPDPARPGPAQPGPGWVSPP